MPQRSRLHEFHRSLGASFQEQGGWELPDRFGDPVREHRAVRESTGCLDLAFRALYRVSGSDRVRFLNGMLTNDIARLEEGQGCYACLLTPQGRIVADLHVYAFRDWHLMDLHAGWKDQALDYLNKYVIADDVRFEGLEAHALVAVQGPGAAPLLPRLFPGIAVPREEHRCVEVPLGGALCQVIRASITGEEGYKFVLPPEQVAPVWKSLHDAGVTPVGMAALHTLRLEAGIPWFGVDFDGDNFPQEAGIEDKAVSFTKGCYVGQEFVIRIAHRGHVNRRIGGLTLHGEPIVHPGDRILGNDREIGRITSAAFAPTLGKIIALGMLRREFHDPGTVVHVEHGQERISAEVTALPFYRRAPE